MAAALVLSAAVAFAGHYAVQSLRPGDYWRAWPIVTTSAVYASALAACLFALLFLAGTRERTRMRAAFWLLFVLLGGALALVAPGGAIFFLAPPLVAAIGMTSASAARLVREGRRDPRRAPALSHLRPCARPVRGADERRPVLGVRAAGRGDPAAGADRARVRSLPGTDARPCLPARSSSPPHFGPLPPLPPPIATTAASCSRSNMPGMPTRAPAGSRSTMTARRCRSRRTGRGPKCPTRCAGAGPPPPLLRPRRRRPPPWSHKGAGPAGAGSGCGSPPMARRSCR